MFGLECNICILPPPFSCTFMFPKFSVTYCVKSLFTVEATSSDLDVVLSDCVAGYRFLPRPTIISH